MSTALFRSRSRWRTVGYNKTCRKSFTGLQTRRYSTPGPEPSKATRSSPHAQFYSDLVPGMIPVALLGSAVYLGLRLYQSRLSHEKYLEETRQRLNELEAELDGLRIRPEQASRQSSSDNVETSQSRRWWFW